MRSAQWQPIGTVSRLAWNASIPDFLPLKYDNAVDPLASTSETSRRDEFDAVVVRSNVQRSDTENTRSFLIGFLLVVASMILR